MATQNGPQPSWIKRDSDLSCRSLFTCSKEAHISYSSHSIFSVVGACLSQFSLVPWLDLGLSHIHSWFQHVSTCFIPRVLEFPSPISLISQKRCHELFRSKKPVQKTFLPRTCRRHPDPGQFDHHDLRSGCRRGGLSTGHGLLRLEAGPEGRRDLRRPRLLPRGCTAGSSASAEGSEGSKGWKNGSKTRRWIGDG